LRVAIFGLGAVAERIHLPACRAVPGLELIAACEPNADQRVSMCRKWQIPHAYPDANALFAAETPEVVMIGTPPGTHRDLALQALERGAHVFCEKPFMESVAEADEVIAAADARGRLIVVNNQYRHKKIYAQVRERLARGDFGRLFFLQCWQQMFHPPSEETNWRAGLRRSTLYEFGTHPLDLITFFFDALPESIYATIPRARPEVSEADVLVQATLRFPGERLATLALNRVSHAPERYLEMRLDCEKASIRISLGGVARASLDWSRAAGRPIARMSFVRGGEARAESGGRSRVIAVEKDEAFASATATHLKKFFEEIQAGKKDNAAARHAREILRIVFAGYESAASGQPQRL